jgi:ABC-type polysaccharide/polyol phosphate export permease
MKNVKILPIQQVKEILVCVYVCVCVCVCVCVHVNARAVSNVLLSVRECIYIVAPIYWKQNNTAQHNAYTWCTLS